MLRYGLAGTHHTASKPSRRASAVISSVATHSGATPTPVASAARASARGMARCAVTAAS
jgi:hypothetical protein